MKPTLAISGWNSTFAKQKNTKNIVVTIHSPDKIPIRSRHALSCYCDKNQIDISEFGDLRFFYNPNYTPAVEPNAMDRTTLKRLNVKRKNVDSNFNIEEPSSAKMSKTNAQIVPITGVTKTFEIESTTDATKNIEIQPTTISDVTNNVEIEHTANVAEIQPAMKGQLISKADLKVFI